MKAENADRKRATRNSIYRYLYNSREFCSRRTLADKLELSLPTVYQNLSELMDMGLVHVTDERLSTGGRKVEGLSVSPDARCAVGVSISADSLRISLVDLCLNETGYKKTALARLDSRGVNCKLIADEVNAFIEEFAVPTERLLGVGFAVPGVVSADKFMLEYAPTLGLRDFSLEELRSEIPYPVHIENDANCGGGAEWFVRDPKQNLAYLSLEQGIGGALFCGGTPFYGDDHRSGEFGHICVEPGGLPCSCGRQGCLEAYCSSKRISTELGITLDEFFKGVEEHNLEYEMLWNDLLRHLAVGINSIRMILDCDVVLGGFLSEYIAPYLPRLKEYLSAMNIFEPSAEYLHLSRRRHTVPVGAALYFITKFLEEL